MSSVKKDKISNKIEIRRGIKNNKLGFIINTPIGSIFVPHSIPQDLIPYLTFKQRADK